MNIILFQPEIPQNTGNIIRTCSVTNSSLTLVPPLGFSLSHRRLKRAGLDYFDEVEIAEVEDLFAFLEKTPYPFYFFSSKATKIYSDVSYTPDDHLIFGCETKGLPSEFFSKWPERFLKIPMMEKQRCLNLSNSVAIVLYEAKRQQGFVF